MSKPIENIDFVVCQICKRKFKQIVRSHLAKAHNMVIADYRKKFPEACTTSQKSFELKSFKSRTVKRKKYEPWSEESKKNHKRVMSDLSKTEGWKDICKRGAETRALVMDETVKKISTSLLNFYSTDEGKEFAKRKADSARGKPRPKASVSLLAFWSSDEGKEIAKRKMVNWKGVPRSQETKDKISKALMGHPVGEKVRLAVSKTQSTRKRSPEEVMKRQTETAQKISETNKAFWYSAEGKQQTEKTIKKRLESGWDEKHRESLQEFWKSEEGKKVRDKLNFIKNTPESREKMSKSIKKAMEGSEYWENRQKGLHLRPNRFEQVVAELLPTSFQYTGDFDPNGMFRFLDGKNKNADFTQFPNRTKVIECFGNYWHGKTGHFEDIDWQEHEKYTVDNYKEIGVSCLIIWEDELKDLACLKNKIDTFCNISIYA